MHIPVPEGNLSLLADSLEASLSTVFHVLGTQMTANRCTSDGVGRKTAKEEHDPGC